MKQVGSKWIKGVNTRDRTRPGSGGSKGKVIVAGANANAGLRSLPMKKIQLR